MKLASMTLVTLLLAGTAGRAAADPIPWRAEDGGNNHHYAAVSLQGGATWEEASAMAAEMSHRGVPGYLATITSASEQAFVSSQLGNIAFYWIGGFQQAGDFAPEEGWAWVSGEPWDYTNWGTGEPNDSAANPDGFENRLQIGRGTELSGWNDLWPSARVIGFVVEFDTATVEGEMSSVGEVKSRY